MLEERSTARCSCRPSKLAPALSSGRHTRETSAMTRVALSLTVEQTQLDCSSPTLPSARRSHPPCRSDAPDAYRAPGGRARGYLNSGSDSRTVEATIEYQRMIGRPRTSLSLHRRLPSPTAPNSVRPDQGGHRRRTRGYRRQWEGVPCCSRGAVAARAPPKRCTKTNQDCWCLVVTVGDDR